MTSAFSPLQTPRVVVVVHEQSQQQEDGLFKTNNNYSSFESETEDEEVKLNCLGGVRGTEESDMNTLDDSDSEDEYEEEDASKNRYVSSLDRKVGVVNFVARLVKPSPRLVKPTASRHSPLSPPLEIYGEDEYDEEEGQDTSEVGARGVALPLETEDEEEESCSESDMEGDDEESSLSDNDDESVASSSSDEEMEEEENDEDETRAQPLALERPVLEEPQAYSQEDESASVILRVLEEEDQDDEEMSSLIDSVESSGQEPLLMEEEALVPRRVDAHLIGVVQDRQVDDNMRTVPRVKRALSLDEALSTNNNNGYCEISFCNKRRKSETDDELHFSLGPPAITPTISTVLYSPARLLSPIISSESPQDSEEDEDEELLLDGQLRYELESTISSGGDQSPVPLLTPPESPVFGSSTCEWPSNLVVDAALTAVLSQVKPLDTCWAEEDDDDNECMVISSPCNLTPLFRGIHV